MKNTSIKMKLLKNQKMTLLIWKKTSLLTQYYEKIRLEELQRYEHKVSENEINAMSKLSKGLVRKLLHYPITHLKGLADGQELDPQTIDTIWRLYRLEEMKDYEEEKK